MRASAVWLLVLVAGCAMGTTPKKFAPANGPAGATVTATAVNKQQMSGELLTVSDTSLTILTANFRIVVAQARALRYVKVKQADLVQLNKQDTFPSKAAETWRLMSRYPQGLSQELLTALLETYHQTAVETFP